MTMSNKEFNEMIQKAWDECHRIDTERKAHWKKANKEIREIENRDEANKAIEAAYAEDRRINNAERIFKTCSCPEAENAHYNVCFIGEFKFSTGIGDWLDGDTMIVHRNFQDKKDEKSFEEVYLPLMSEAYTKEESPWKQEHMSFIDSDKFFIERLSWGENFSDPSKWSHPDLRVTLKK